VDAPNQSHKHASKGGHPLLLPFLASFWSYLASTVVHGMARSGSSCWVILARATSKLSRAAVLFSLSSSPPFAGGGAAGDEAMLFSVRPKYPCVCVVCVCVQY